MKKVKVTIELEMTNKYYEDDYAEIVYQLKECKNDKKDLTTVVVDFDDFVDDNACDVLNVTLEEVE